MSDIEEGEIRDTSILLNIKKLNEMNKSSSLLFINELKEDKNIKKNNICINNVKSSFPNNRTSDINEHLDKINNKYNTSVSQSNSGLSSLQNPLSSSNIGLENTNADVSDIGKTSIKGSSDVNPDNSSKIEGFEQQRAVQSQSPISSIEQNMLNNVIKNIQ